MSQKSSKQTQSPATDKAGLTRGLELALVFGGCAILLIILCDTDGYEGDDLNSIVPMLHLPEALSGVFELYKFDWQPLAYWMGWITYQITGSITAVFLLAPLAIAAAVVMLYYILTVELGVTRPVAAALLMMFPEILYTGMYFNSSAMAYPFSVMAVLLVFVGSSQYSAILSGFLLAFAAMFRLDFLLIVPAVMLLWLYQTGSRRNAILAGVAASIGLGSAFALGLFDVNRVLEIYQSSRIEMSNRAGEVGWDARTKFLVATTIFSPVGWGYLIVAVAHFLRNISRLAWGWTLTLLLSLAPLLLAAMNILSVKYMMPAFVVLPIFAGMSWASSIEGLGRTGRLFASALVFGLTALLIVASVEPAKEPPFLTITHDHARQIGTHDGDRSWGSYFRQMMGIERDAKPTAKGEAADAFVSLAGIPDGRIVWLVGAENYFLPGGLGWRYIYTRLEKAGYRGYSPGDGTIHFRVPFGEIVLAKPDFAIADGACTINLDEVSDPAAYVRANCYR